MKYIVLLRGINVGGNKQLDMKSLRLFFENLGYNDVSSYINSGNIILSSNKKLNSKKISQALAQQFGFSTSLLIKTSREMKNIAKAIPTKWQNDSSQRTEVAYLFPEIDHKSIVAELPMKMEYVDARYVKGALILHLLRKNYSKSRLNKLIGHKLYKSMTLRNVNTARHLADI